MVFQPFMSMGGAVTLIKYGFELDTGRGGGVWTVLFDFEPQWPSWSYSLEANLRQGDQ